MRADDAHWSDIGAGVEIGDSVAGKQGGELVHHVDTGTAAVDVSGHALRDADAVGIGEAERPVGMDVNVYPTRAQHVPIEIDDLRPRWNGTADRCNVSIGNDHVIDAVDRLDRIDDPGAAQHQRVRILCHRYLRDFGDDTTHSLLSATSRRSTSRNHTFAAVTSTSISNSGNNSSGT